MPYHVYNNRHLTLSLLRRVLISVNESREYMLTCKSLLINFPVITAKIVENFSIQFNSLYIHGDVTLIRHSIFIISYTK